MPPLPVIAIAVLWLVAVLMLVIHNYVPRYGYTWLVALTGAFIAWMIMLISRLSIPQIFQMKIWQFVSISTHTPTLLLDDISWIFALSITTLLLSVLLTDAARATETDWSAWISSLILSAFGLLAVLARNPLTLLLAWVAIDFAELLVMFWHVQSGLNRERVVLIFATRMAGIILLLWAWLASRQDAIPLSFENMPQEVTIFLLFAAWMRLGLIPIQWPQFQESSTRRSLGTLASLVTAASSFVLIVRVAHVGVPSGQIPLMLLLAGIVAFYGSFSWYFSANELEGRPYWIVAFSALSIAAASRAQPSASLVWGLSAILTGGVLFLYSARRRLLILLPILGLINMLLIPATLSWNGVNLFTPPFSLRLVFFLFAQALLLAGYFRLARIAGETIIEAERWVWIVYTVGLGLIAIIQFPIAFIVNINNLAWVTPINLTTLWPGLVILCLAGLILYLSARGLRLSFSSQDWIRKVFSLGWIYRAVGYIYQLVGRIITVLTFVLEGEGGVLWVLLWLALIYVLISQGNLGGI